MNEYEVFILEIDKLNNAEDAIECSDKEFMALSEKQNNVFSLKAFVSSYNGDGISSHNTFIRILKPIILSLGDK